MFRRVKRKIAIAIELSTGAVKGHIEQQEKEEKRECATRPRVCVEKKHLIFMGQLIGLWSPLADRISLNHRSYTPRKELVVPSSPLRGRKTAVRSSVRFTQGRRMRNEGKKISIEGTTHRYYVYSILLEQCDVLDCFMEMCVLLG